MKTVYKLTYLIKIRFKKKKIIYMKQISMFLPLI